MFKLSVNVKSFVECDFMYLYTIYLLMYRKKKTIFKRFLFVRAVIHNFYFLPFFWNTLEVRWLLRKYIQASDFIHHTLFAAIKTIFFLSFYPKSFAKFNDSKENYTDVYVHFSRDRLYIQHKRVLLIQLNNIYNIYIGILYSMHTYSIESKHSIF